MMAASAEFLPLADEIISAKTTVNSAKVELLAYAQHLSLLQENLEIVDESIAVMAVTPLARAVKEPVVVLFVPYGNIENFSQGQPLYTCRVGIVFCAKAGITGEVIPGEVEAIHPFFGKNMRGVFVEAELTNKNAEREEILHVGHPPLFF